MIRLLRVFANTKCEDTALNAARGQQKVNAGNKFSGALHVFAILLAFTHPVAALSAPTTTDAVRSPDQKPPLVALASSFRSVWPKLMEAYLEKDDNRPPLTSFASSGLLSTQILRGAPFELFLSADERSVTRLEHAGKTQTQPIAFANGTLSLITRLDLAKSGKEPLSISSIGESLTLENSLKIAIPNPRHAPYGIAAQQALTTKGVWPIPRGSLLNAENASQALQYVLSGAAAIAIVPTTLVAQKSFDINVSNIDPDSYEAVVHHLALLAPAGDNARKLRDWLTTPKALQIMMKFGLAAP